MLHLSVVSVTCSTSGRNSHSYRLLKNRVDKLVWQFRESQPDFYQKYQVARSIVQPPSNGAEEVTILAAPGATPTAQAA